MDYRKHNRRYIGDRTYKYFGLRKPGKKQDEWHIVEIPYPVAVHEYQLNDDGEMVTFYDYTRIDDNTPRLTHIDRDIKHNLNNISSGSYMIADMDKDVEYFKTKMKEYICSNIAKEQETIEYLKYVVSLLDNL